MTKFLVVVLACYVAMRAASVAASSLQSVKLVALPSPRVENKTSEDCIITASIKLFHCVQGAKNSLVCIWNLLLDLIDCLAHANPKALLRDFFHSSVTVGEVHDLIERVKCKYDVALDFGGCTGSQGLSEKKIVKCLVKKVPLLEKCYPDSPDN